MNKYHVILLSAALMIGVESAEAGMTINSESILNGSISTEQACRKKGGKNLSPQISITEIPETAKYISIIIDDPDAIPVAGKTWVHWNVMNIPINGSSYQLSAGKAPSEGQIGKQSGGSGYGGMCPPNGKHTYRFVAFAHATEIPAKTSGWSGKAYTVESFRKDFGDSILTEASTTGDYR